LASNYQLGNNVLYNETDIREFHFIINGKQPEANKTTESRAVKFTGHRCIGSDCFPEAAPEAECSNETRHWSEAIDWSLETDPTKRSATGNTIPGKGASFKIPTGWNM
jgi:hypothetical protein